MNTAHTHSSSQPVAPQVTDLFDVAIIGGGAAGLSAGLVLGRARRSVIVIDAASPRNAPAAGVHGFLTRDGLPPAELVAIGRREVEQYGGTVVHAQALSARRTAEGFEVAVDGNRVVRARRVLVTTGLKDELPAIPGLRELWGQDVLHCPYCHGWEVRDQAIGIIGTGSRSFHQVSMFRQWSADLTLFTHTMPVLTDEQVEELAARDIRVVHGTVAALDTTDGHLSGVRLEDGTLVPVRAVAVMPRMVARAGFLADLGLHPTVHPAGIGEHIAAVDPTGKTTVPGVWVAGNVTDLMAQVGAAAAGAATAAAAINADLIAEETRLAVISYRQRHRVTAELTTARAS